MSWSWKLLSDASGELSDASGDEFYVSIIECDNIDDRYSSDKFYPHTKCETPKQDNDTAY